MAQLAVTLLITVPAMLNVYRELNIYTASNTAFALRYFNARYYEFNCWAAQPWLRQCSFDLMCSGMRCPLQLVGIVVNAIFAVVSGIIRKRRRRAGYRIEIQKRDWRQL